MSSTEALPSRLHGVADRIPASLGLAAGDDLGLMLAGGYAMCAHDLVDRPSQDIDFATAAALPLDAVTDRLGARCWPSRTRWG
ncbi:MULTISPECIES: hypothetical protein [unclassified Micromonospora]|uniref:hypothetical protein n=1 Tax=unclassified Micromonospora TaxID=2617518 RepID=UPI001E2B1DE3|nr:MULTISPECIES: hypothetical protein [unclassified Micromonospora]MCZ7473305.1 hypothetical protein [Micromonospora sp. WMMC273]WBC03967.1 hypothetical protein O7546_03045 [Micromonospora sp. WMMA1976]